MLSRSSLVFSLLLTGCGPCPEPAHPEAPAAEPAVTPSPAAPGAGPGQLDAETAALAASLSGVDKIEVEIGAAGAVEAISIYHHDEAHVPAAVRQLAEQRFPGATVRSYETELYRAGGRTYEVEVTTSDGNACELSATAEATLRYVECEVPAAELPAAVTATIASTVSGGEVREAEKKTDAAGTDTFSVEVVAGGVEHYLRIAADGALRGHGLRRPATIEVPAP